MCGVLGIVSQQPVNQWLYDGLLFLQHRGQDAAGIATTHDNAFHLHKGNGLVNRVFRTRHMRALVGNAGIAHVRYPTAGSASSAAEAQPFYVNSPFGIMLAHNGSLTNATQLKQEMFELDLRHINTGSDSEVLLNVFAHELARCAKTTQLSIDAIFNAVAGVHKRCRGAYAVVALIAGYGLVAFRDPYGIRPLVFGQANTPAGPAYLVASESVALDCLGFKMIRDVAAGEAIFIPFHGEYHHRQCAENPSLNPCSFEFVYFARPDSVMDGASVYQTRLNMGENLAEKVRSVLGEARIDVVIPIPDTSRPSALQLANCLQLPYRDGFIKNRYIGRTFIMPGQAIRRKSVRQKLNPIHVEFAGKNVLLVDDSIVRGTTSREIVQMARDAGAAKVYFASAAPPVRFPYVYGIDMPSGGELLASGRSAEEIAVEIGADALIYQDLAGLKDAVQRANPRNQDFDLSCFNGVYTTGDITAAYLKEVAVQRATDTLSSSPAIDAYRLAEPKRIYKRRNDGHECIGVSYALA